MLLPPFLLHTVTPRRQLPYTQKAIITSQIIAVLEEEEEEEEEEED
jgi:hypothetical protein